MPNRIFRVTNGVSFGAKYTIVAADDTAGNVTIQLMEQEHLQLHIQL
jgi:hypothetical protein